MRRRRATGPSWPSKRSGRWKQAAAAAEVARRNAEAVAAVQQELLIELELWDAPQEFSRGTAEVVEVVEPTSQMHDVGQQGVASGGGLTVRLYEDLGERVGAGVRSEAWEAMPDAEESRALDAEIAFRKSPVFEDYKAFLAHDREPPVALPANLLEFPRQLVAARKARPRLAEGPLLEDAPRSAQLRIFEVEPEQISTAPVVAPPEWTSSIRLDAHSVRGAAASEGAGAMAAGVQPGTALLLAMTAPLPQTASLGLRAMAALVDLGLVLAALVVFVGAFAEVAGQVPGGVAGTVALAATGAAFYLMYQVLFFSFSDQTAGMRYARIGLCTLSDENPTRSAMRKRVLAQLVAVCPLGLGLLWSLLDEDGLGWHDRISRCISGRIEKVSAKTDGYRCGCVEWL